MSITLAPQYTQRIYQWTAWKIIQAAKDFAPQYDDDGTVYTVWGYDGPEVHVCTIWKGTVPDGVIATGYSQAQNDADKADFVANFLPGANGVIATVVGGRDGDNNILTVGVTYGGAVVAEAMHDAISRGRFSNFVYDHAGGYVGTAALTTVPVRPSAYTEQSSNARRSVVSTSATDTSAGTGARTVRIVYFDSTMAGPFTTDVTLNGTTPVNTGVSDLCYIQRFYVLTCGSNGGNAGTINLKAATGGGGATITSISAGDNDIYSAHVYVPVNKRALVTQIILTAQLQSYNFFLRTKNPLNANDVEAQIRPTLRATSSVGSIAIEFKQPLVLLGPTRLTVYTRCDIVTAGTAHAGVVYNWA